ncbi:DoxX family membrane protein [Acinetobacter sp. A1]|uniref:DoxX family protein n=1 Tax=Acinetobacter sp. A1 TaxID=401467 RepID=UPI0014469161|nr:DoxX family membrane protein [Acinetobacter sp. A1]
MFNPNVVLKSVVEKASVQAIVSLFSRAFLAYLFIVSGWGKIAGYDATVGYMQAMGVSGSLLPLVILLELGGGLAGGFFYIMLYGAGKISLDHLLEAKK